MKEFFSYISNKLASGWKWANGKKTVIGTILLLVSEGLKAFAPDLLSANQVGYISLVGSTLAFGGLVHKGAKTDVVNNALKRIINK